jgi:hypothetical protein
MVLVLVLLGWLRVPIRHPWETLLHGLLLRRLLLLLVDTSVRKLPRHSRWTHRVTYHTTTHAHPTAHLGAHHRRAAHPRRRIHRHADFSLRTSIRRPRRWRMLLLTMQLLLLLLILLLHPRRSLHLLVKVRLLRCGGFRLIWVRIAVSHGELMWLLSIKSAICVLTTWRSL